MTLTNRPALAGGVFERESHESTGTHCLVCQRHVLSREAVNGGSSCGRLDWKLVMESSLLDWRGHQIG